MQNLMKTPLLSGGSDFAMNLSMNDKATLEIQGYCLRLTKAGKLKFPKYSQGNLSFLDIEKIKERCTDDDVPFSGKGGMVYQLTCFTNAKDNNTFVNGFNPQRDAGTIINVECYQRKNSDGSLATYEGANGTQPSLALRIYTEGEETEENSNANLEQAPVINANLEQPPVDEE